MYSLNKYQMDFDESYFTKLPMEIIIKIFDYLTVMDLCAASRVCRRWFDASQEQHFKEKMCVNFYKVHFSNESNPVYDFLQSFRDFPNVVLDQVDFSQNDGDQFWTQFGGQIINLSIKSCDLRERTFCRILKKLQNLESLKIEKCRELFMSGRLFETEKSSYGGDGGNSDFIDEQKLRFTNLKSLGITHNRYLSDAIFNRIVGMAPELEDLDMSGCHISFHKGLYRRFYPHKQIDPSESILTFHFISQFIYQQAKKLRSLNFSETLVDGVALSTLAEIENLRLEKLEFIRCDQLTNEGIRNLVQRQTSLTYLDLSMSVRLTDRSLIDICDNLIELQTLKLSRCRILTDLGVREIYKLKKLKSLDISGCENVTNGGVYNGVAKARNEVLEELRVSSLNLAENSALRIIENFPNLRVLDLSCCFNAVTELVMQLIFKNLTSLRELNLDYCTQVTDESLTGMDMGEKLENYEKMPKNEEPLNSKEVDGNVPQNVVNLAAVPESLRRDPYKISLGSKAEDEIKRDAKRKQILQEMCEKDLSNSDWSGYSVASLRGLNILRLTGCNRITDISLQYNFRLPELREISFGQCQQISLEGINELVKNCPSLEHVNLAECHNITDKAIEVLTEGLKRLTHLNLERCNILSDYSLDHITVNCKSIKVVDIRGCRNMCPDPAMRLSTVLTLRDIYMSKPGPYVTPLLINSMRRPTPPPFPSYR